jgi:hypothetical protein
MAFVIIGLLMAFVLLWLGGGFGINDHSSFGMAWKLIGLHCAGVLYCSEHNIGNLCCSSLFTFMYSVPHFQFLAHQLVIMLFLIPRQLHREQIVGLDPKQQIYVVLVSGLDGEVTLVLLGVFRINHRTVRLNGVCNSLI